jgi:hypothetical protein
MSPLTDPKALAVNALAVSWDGMNAFAFPPTPLIQAMLNKVMTDKVRLYPITPCWPSQAWFPTLLELLTVHPRRLPEWDHLLWHPLGRVYHNSPSFYKLHAWKLSGASSEQNNLLRGGEPLTLISQSGLSTKLGVGRKGFIQSFLLFPSWWIFSTTFSQKGNFKGYKSAFSTFLRLIGCWENSVLEVSYSISLVHLE